MRRRGFTLTEMLVVLGIILVLLGIIIPTIMKVQREAKLTQCQARIRDIGKALTLYLNDYESYLPPGGWSNSDGSPGSPHWMMAKDNGGQLSMTVKINEWGAHAEATSLWPEEEVGLKRGVGPPGYPYAIPPLAYFLKKYLQPTMKSWSCPGAARNDAGMSALAGPDEDDRRVGALAGYQGSDVFVPGYRYMGTADFWFGLHTRRMTENLDLPPPLQPNRAKGEMWHIFLSRNIGGLKVDRIVTLRKERSERIVVCFEKTFYNHTLRTDGGVGGGRTTWMPDPTDWIPRPGDLFPPEGGPLKGNFLYLDGHVEYKSFGSQLQFVRLLHDQVPQRWGYVQLLERTAMEYPWMAFGTKPVR